jgi:hypothetical protein
MRGSTLAIIKTAVAGDPVRGESDKTAIMVALGLQPELGLKADDPKRIVGFAEAARFLSCHVRTVQLLCKQGLLRRVILPGRKLSKGVIRADLENLAAGGRTAGATEGGAA